ncbi:MAG: hypothetical protein IPF56_08950 [Chloroflexi bacterium]|nr:hypothetical protein [Chloroflexota bacterium]MBK6709353.1 hypothetical protein [Chloroflexota bacterium]
MMTEITPGNAEQPQTTASWLADTAVTQIHNAFRLGWSLVELRSRVQIAALDDPKLPQMVDSSRVRVYSDPLQMVQDANNGLRRASQMRTIFNSIVTLQQSSFPALTNISQIYDPPPQSDLPYLYPQDTADPDTLDYANFGIDPLEIDESNPFWSNFRLYDVSRRALNCLNLLLSDPLDNLVPDLITRQQNRLIQKISDVLKPESDASTAVTPGPAIDSLTKATLQACVDYKSTNPEAYDAKTPSADNQRLTTQQTEIGHREAIVALSVLSARLFQAWDGFLRERFTTSGVGTKNLNALLAYEAGRNLASISWNTSVNAVRLENQAEQDQNAHQNLCQMWQDTFTDSGVTHVLHQISALSAVFDDVYYRTHEKPAAFKTDNTLDDLLVRPDPSLPSNVLQAVKQSIEYWQRTVIWLGAEEKPDNAEARSLEKPQMQVADWRRLRETLIEQSGIWYNLMTGQQDLRGFTVEGIAQGLMDEAIGDLRGLAQRDLPAAFQQASQQIDEMARDVAEFVASISGTATKVAQEGINRIFDSVHPVFWVIIGISAVVVVGLVGYAFATKQTDVLIGAMASMGTAVAGMFGIKRGSDSKDETKNNVQTQIEDQKTVKTQEMTNKTQQLQNAISQARTGLAGTASSALGQAGSFLVDAYENGLLRIQIELQSLNHSIAVAHPLVEFFIRNSNVESDLDFLTKVIWDKGSRETQLRNVVTAAFGPISILLGAPAETRNTTPVTGD